MDRYSDADFFICLEPELRDKLVSTNWTADIAPVALQFPLVLPDEVRVLFKGYFDSDFHYYTPEDLKNLHGPCKLGDYISQGWQIIYDPRGLLEQLQIRIQPQPPKHDGDVYATTPAVFWFNIVLCAKYMLRGDLFRAYRLSNWWLQQMLLEMLAPNLSEESLRHKDVANRFPEHYEQLSRCFARLDHKDMVRAMIECMDLFWTICRDKSVILKAEEKQQFLYIHNDVLKLFEADESSLEL